MSEDMQMFNAYQRSLARQLDTLKAALTAKDYVLAERIVDELIEDTQANLSDKNN